MTNNHILCKSANFRYWNCVNTIQLQCLKDDEKLIPEEKKCI